MASQTSIEWTATYNDDGTVTKGYNWNFLRGCSRVSEGCRNCYAEGVAARFSGYDTNGKALPYFGLAQMVSGKPRWTGEISFHKDILLQPLRWTKPRKVFVNSMSDLFHEKVTDEMLDKALAVMALTPQHTYQILTKRPERMREYLDNCNWEPRVYDAVASIARRMHWKRWPDDGQFINRIEPLLFLPNVWLGVSVEDQKTADERIPLLLDAPAALRWISAEPLLGPIDLSHFILSRYQRATDLQMGATFYLGEPIELDWVVVGGESGPGARPCDIGWIRSVVAQCKAANVPVFVKQLGAQPFEPARYQIVGDTGLYLNSRKGGDINEWPEDLRVREFPTVEKSLPAHAL